MPKKRGHKKTTGEDFTINDFANASKPITKGKHTVEVTPTDTSWDEINFADFDVIEEVEADGTKKIVYKKKRQTKCELEAFDDRPGVVYPEIVWYLISRFIKPENVGSFVGINRTTYSISKREYFWRKLYINYCEKNPKLPERLRLENSFKQYGLRQRVIRALYHTYHVFISKVVEQTFKSTRPHDLIKRRCVNVWYCKANIYWCFYFKMKKICSRKKIERLDFIEELGRIDANPEEDSQVLKVICSHFYEVPPIMGMTLSLVKTSLSMGVQGQRRLQLGFNTNPYNVSCNILPEYYVTMEKVINFSVLDWWHPSYPHFDNQLPPNTCVETEEILPALKQNFY